MTHKNAGLRSSAIALASCLVLSGMPLIAQAAGLGKLVVLSPLGQPLRAEIEVSATREELADMKAQLASPESFKQAGVDYATTLLSIRFNLDKRPNGQSVIRLSSDKPINDPFIDMLLELNWPSGRLVREYTFLLDPPEAPAAKAQAPVAPATVKSTTSKSAAAQSASSAVDEDVRAKAAAHVRAQSDSKASEQATEKTTDGGTDTRVVKSGETLRKIAGETKPDGISLEQMLVGLLRANQDAFDGGNMNRLKAGKILSLPERSALEAVSVDEAKKIVVTQSADWNAYRSKLAGVAAQAPVAEEAAKQESGGKITAKVEDKAAPAEEPKDQLKVSKTEAAAGKKSGAAAKLSEEDLVAKEKALKEATERQAMLEKNVAELNKLLEMKNQQLADLQKQAAAKEVSAEASKPVAEAKPAAPAPAPAQAETPAPAPAPAAEAQAEVKATEEPAKPEAAPPPPAAEAAPPPPAAEAAPAPKAAEAPKPVTPPPPAPPADEPGFVAELMDNPLALPIAGGGILALIAAYFVSRRRRAGKSEVPLDLSSTLTPQSSMTGNSVFRNTGGQSVDTSHTPAHTDFSQAGPGSIDTDEVDPVAEADVYMAYGRDAQAEEILVEAKLKDPKRYAIHLKLLEIYANRKDLKQFESLATDLYSETGGVGADWEKAAAMGIKLDPGNPLFGGESSAPAAFNADSTVIVSSQSMKNTVTMPGELSKLAESAKAPEQAPVAKVASVATAASIAATAAVVAEEAPELTSLDFDLGVSTDPEFVDLTEKPESVSDYQLPETEASRGSLDFDLAEAPAAPAAPVLDTSATLVMPEPEAEREVASLDFDLGFESSAAPVSETAPAPAFVAAEPAAEPELGDGVEFDVSLTESTFLGRSMPEPTSFDLNSINLDLNQPDLSIAPPAPESAPLQAAAEEVPASEGDAFDSVLASTAVNPDFGIAQAETVVNPQFGADQDMLPEFDISENEEVATKLDLAKAYEEMGDLEGARELLNEVLKEGDAAQKDKAKAILGKIGA